ncbi:type IV secretion system protein [Bartonella sp. B12(2025)]
MRKLSIIVIISAIFATLNLARSSEEMASPEEGNILTLTEKIHDSITGSRTATSMPKQGGDLLFPNPQYIYDQDKQTEIAQQIPKLFGQIIRNENSLYESSMEDARESIDERSQYAAVIDKVVALQTFKETESRFEQISRILTDIEKMKDLKGIAELQVRMKGMLAMIQNEATKLQMVSYLRNTEKVLIDRLKRKRNVQILQKKNTKMPAIR